MTYPAPKYRRVIVGLLLTVALPSTPALAQDAAAPTITPPAAPAPTLITPPAPPPATATPAPSASAVQPALRNGVPVPGAQPAEEAAAEEAEAPAPAVRRPARQRPAARRAPVRETAAPAPVEAAAPVAQSAPPAPIAEPPLTEPVAALPEPAPAAEPVAAPRQADATQYWPIAAAAALVALGLIAFALRRRRRRREEELEYQHDAYAPVEEPIAMAAEPMPEPVAPRHDPVPAPAAPAAFAGTAGVAGAAEARRPWLEFMMTPRRAGTSEDEAIVEFDLTVANKGAVPANDVRIATWMFADGQLPASEMERLLIEPPAGSQSEPMSIPPGERTHVEGAIALPKATLGDTVLPVVVADARYSLPDGSEGRTSTSFAVGLPNGGGLQPFPVDQSPAVHEKVEAHVKEELQRA